LNPWVLEINSNPSFNVNISRFEKLEGTDDYKFKSEVSEIDKHIKKIVIGDAIKVVTSKMALVDKLGSFKRLYPSIYSH